MRVSSPRHAMMLLLMCALSALMLPPKSAQACTAVYVGSEASADGSTIVARSNDYMQLWANHLEIVDHVEDQPGRTMPVSKDGTVQAPIPATTFRYTSTPWMDSAIATAKRGRDATACTNECGVAMSMSVTGATNQQALEADPLVEGGLTEFTAVDLVLCQSQTARQAIEVLCKLIDEYGSSEYNIALVADQDEAWYMEIYTGHQYAAVQLPKDKVAAFGNEFTLQYLSDYAKKLTSKELEEIPKKHGFAQWNDKGDLDLYRTYSGDGLTLNYNRMRTWMGHQLLAPSVFGGEYQKEELYPLCFVPDEKVSVHAVMELLRNRFEGTEYSPDETGRGDMRVIGIETAMSVHVLQVDPKLPAWMSCITWECVGPSPYGVFVPLSNACLHVSESYGRNQPANEAGQFDSANYPYYTFKELNTLCTEQMYYKAYGRPVRDYWHGAEENMLQEMHAIQYEVANMDERAAKQRITNYCDFVQDQAFADAKRLLNDVRWNMSAQSSAVKNVREREITDERRELDVMQIDLNNAVYRRTQDNVATRTGDGVAIEAQQQATSRRGGGTQGQEGFFGESFTIALAVAIGGVIATAIILLARYVVGN